MSEESSVEEGDETVLRSIHHHGAHNVSQFICMII